MAYGPYGNGCEDTLGFSRGGDSAPITINLNSDHTQGAWSVQVSVGAGGYGNFGFADQGVAFSTQSYRYVHLWVKPLTAGSWLSFHCWDIAGSRWLGMNGDKDGDETYEAGEDFVAGQWNEVWVDLRQNSQGFAGGDVRQFHMHSSPNSQFLVDGIYTVSQPWQTFYYHCDYLGSPRLMTDASGNVVPRLRSGQVLEAGLLRLRRRLRWHRYRQHPQVHRACAGCGDGAVLCQGQVLYYTIRPVEPAGAAAEGGAREEVFSESADVKSVCVLCEQSTNLYRSNW